MTLEKQQALEFIKPKVKSIKERIRKAIRETNRGLTSKEIVSYLSVKLQTVTGRLDEMQDKGFIYGVVKKGLVSETVYYVEDNPERQRQLALIRSEDKFYADLRKWESRYKDIISEATFERIKLEAEVNFKNRTHA
jgi:DNA-binding MarR family transcriptional regulator